MIPVYLVSPQPDNQTPHASVALSDPVLNGAGICYLLAKDGIYKQVNNNFYSARVKVAGVPHLAEIKEGLDIRLPKLPLPLFQQAEAFFVAVYGQHQSEAVLLL